MDEQVARAGKPLTILVPCAGLAPGAPVSVRIFEPHAVGGDPLETLTASVDPEGGAARVQWTYDYARHKDRIAASRFVFLVEAAGRFSVSRPIRFVETFQATIKDEHGHPAADREVVLHPDRGEAIHAATNSQGKLRIEVPPGDYHLELLGPAPDSLPRPPLDAPDEPAHGAGDPANAQGGGDDKTGEAAGSGGDHWAVVLEWDEGPTRVTSVELAAEDGGGYRHVRKRDQATVRDGHLLFEFPEGKPGRFTATVRSADGGAVVEGIVVGGEAALAGGGDRSGDEPPASALVDGPRAPDPTSGGPAAGDQAPLSLLVCAVERGPPKVIRGRITGFHFDTNKAFVLPSMMTGIRQLVSLYNDHALAGIVVTGHTDTVGDADYNRGLSSERADAVKTFLKDEVDEWLAWYAGKPHSKAWGVHEDQLMLGAVASAGGAPFFSGEATGKLDAPTRSAYRDFQTEKGLPASGSPDKATRRALVAAYMALDGTSLPREAEALRHGCGFAHPAVETGPGVDEPRNRRVEVFLFETAIAPRPQKTCPAAGCAEFPVWLGATQLTVDLDTKPVDVLFTVKAPDGRRVPTARVRFDGPSGSGEATTSQETEGPKAGVVRFDQLIPGTYTFTVDKDGARTQQRVAVSAGASGTAAADSPSSGGGTRSSLVDAPGGSKAKTGSDVKDAGEPSDGGAPQQVSSTVKDREFYRRVAWQNAFGAFDPEKFDPTQRFNAENRGRMVKIYEYYGKTYFKDPGKFFWMGMGRLAGAEILGGLDLVVALSNRSSVAFLEEKFVQIAKTIFEDIAWQHEAILDSTADGLESAFRLLAQYDRDHPALNSYEKAWKKIFSPDDPDGVAKGNKDLLENEQKSIVQPFYTEIDRRDPGLLSTASAFTSNIHPYHRDFFTEMGSAVKITNVDDRWNWITKTVHSMLPVWAERHPGQYGKLDGMPQAERSRLVALSLDDLTHHRFGSVIQDLLPPGSP